MTASAADPVVPEELPVPTPKGFWYLPRVIFGMTFAFCFFGFFLFLALKNLIDFRHTTLGSFIASAVWLVLFPTVAIGSSAELGFRQNVVNFLSLFSEDHFVVLVYPDSGPACVGFAYRLLGFRIFTLLAELDGVERLSWHWGQASSFAHKDLNDWTVGIWVRNDALRGTRLRTFGNDRDSVYVVYSLRQRIVVDKFGRELIDFLRREGIEFEELQDGGATKFARKR